MISHGHTAISASPTYNTWAGMKNRCSNKSHKDYKSYGGNGITVCERWMTFENFLADMGEKPPGCSLDRIDYTLGYFKENCRWATVKDQARNKRNNTLITANGKTMCMQAWVDLTGIHQTTLSHRINNGWSHEDAINTPVANNRDAALRRPSTKMITHNGKTMCMSDWAREAGILPSRLYARLKQGWPMERALKPN